MKNIKKEFDFELDNGELQILENLENGNYISLKETNPKEFEKEKEIAKIAAENTLKKLAKKKAYTLKLFEDDIEKIKSMAFKKGLPYQTYIASLIHQIATKQIEI